MQEAFLSKTIFVLDSWHSFLIESLGLNKSLFLSVTAQMSLSAVRQRVGVSRRFDADDHVNVPNTAQSTLGTIVNAPRSTE